jgi:DNA-binding NarL/FixJ family response regulator
VVQDSRIVSVVAVNDYELVVAGVTAMLSALPEQIEVRPGIIIGEPIDSFIDVALYDTYGRVGIAGPALTTLVDDPKIGAVAVYSLDLNDKLVSDARDAGAAAFISKALPAKQVADAIVEVAAGVPVFATPGPSGHGDAPSDWPGKDTGLSERQSQVLVLASEGLTNREIATALYLSPETVKSYLREVFLKLGFRNRSEATAFVHRSGAFVRYQSAHLPSSDDPETDLSTR